MAATGRRLDAFAWAICFLVCAAPLHADRLGDVRAQITYVASALASGNPTDALSPFDKTMPEYDKLAEYFAALTNSYDVVSEIEIADEDDQEKETTLKAAWTLQLSDKGNESNIRRSFDVTLNLKPVKGKWMIFRFTPVEMFNPQVPIKPNH